MRKDGGETWNRYAQEKGAVHDLKDGFKVVSFLSNHELYTVGQLGRYIAETKQAFSKIKAESAAKERRIRDIDALFGAIQTIRELKPIQQEYENIHWNGKREKFKAEHGEELNRLKKAIWLREKLVKSLGLASPLDKEQRAALKTERMQLEAEREALLPKLEEVKAELAELNRIRYWMRKVIPDALPRVSDGRVSMTLISGMLFTTAASVLEYSGNIGNQASFQTMAEVQTTALDEMNAITGVKYMVHCA